jgi:hypothetical protein
MSWHSNGLFTAETQRSNPTAKKSECLAQRRKARKENTFKTWRSWRLGGRIILSALSASVVNYRINHKRSETMKTFLMSIVIAAALLFMSLADFRPESLLRLGFVRNAEAIIGMPRTPLSVAGVARRSMYREAAVVSTVAVTSAAAANAAAANMAYANAAAAQAAAANTAAAQAAAANAAAAAAAAQQAAAGLPIGTMVPSLPPGCTSTVIGGVNYFQCGAVYYRAGFQGNNIVYIVSAP